MGNWRIELKGSGLAGQPTDPQDISRAAQDCIGYLTTCGHTVEAGYVRLEGDHPVTLKPAAPSPRTPAKAPQAEEARGDKPS